MEHSLPYTKAEVLRFDLSRRITQRNFLAVLVSGFTLVMLLLLASAAIAVQNSREIQDEAQELITEQSLTLRLMNQMRLEQATLNAVFYQLTHDPESINRGDLVRQLDTATETVSRLVSNARTTPEAHLWAELEHSAQGFSEEAKRLIASENLSDASVKDLFRRHDAVVTVVRQLAIASSERARKAESRITSQTQVLVDESVWLLGGSLLLALVCAILTVRFAAALFDRMERQASELSRVSWHMLQGQEEAARRFSHELHDELGQSLTALKANTTALTAENLGTRRADCLDLINESISNVRELSQLLRPVILDDFGLDAGLRWFAEKFETRSGIQVDYQSDFHGRVVDQTETHLFRIAQEALTNVARHSAATRVQIRLAAKDSRLILTIADNGRGLQGHERDKGIGLVGMRARARHAGGDFVVNSSEGSGVRIEVWVPLTLSPENAAKENAHPVGR
jgi:signal transduction histidine kinase